MTENLKYISELKTHGKLKRIGS